MSIASNMAGMAGEPGGPVRPSGREEPSEGEAGGVGEHLAALHAKMGGKHMHVQSDGASYTSHQVGEDGKVEGPHDHENLEVLKEAMNQFFTEEEQEQPSKESEGLL